MTTIARAIIVPYSSEQMYQLVNDIRRYPEFVPYCKKSVIHNKTPDEIRATLYLAKAGFERSFSTSNRLQKNKMIEITLLDGPFKHLNGYWRFSEAEKNGCKIEFDLHFEFSNRLFTTLFGPVFTQMANLLVESFCNRARSVYGVILPTDELYGN